jgi:hypothetical protein
VNRLGLAVVGFIAALFAVLVLRALPGIVVLAVFIAGTAYASTWLKRQARQDVGKTGAEMLGLRRESGDPFGLLAFPLALFARTSNQEIAELVWGPWQGLEVTVFGLSFDAPSLPSSPGSRAAFACALTKIDSSFPSLVAEPQALMTSFERAPTSEAVQLDDPVFDHEWNVWSDDASFAGAVLDEPMRGWLRSLGDSWGMEVGGSMAVVYGPRPSSPDVFGVLEALKGLVEHIPSEVRAAHPEGKRTKRKAASSRRRRPAVRLSAESTRKEAT